MLVSSEGDSIKKETYNNFDILHLNNASYTYACKKLNNNNYFYILVKHVNSSVDYLNICKKYIDKINVNKIDSKLVKDSGYITKYKEGWFSVKDGYHLYLDKNGQVHIKMLNKVIQRAKLLKQYANNYNPSNNNGSIFENNSCDTSFTSDNYDIEADKSASSNQQNNNTNNHFIYIYGN